MERIRFIRSAQQLGFSLPEIRDLLLLLREPGNGCSHVRDLLRGKLGTVREKIRTLAGLERLLAGNLRRCERNLSGAGRHSSDGCPVLKAISRGRRDG